MPIRFHCPKCHVRLSVAQRKAGQVSPCPNCRQPITIPLDGSPNPVTSTDEESASPPLDKLSQPSETPHWPVRTEPGARAGSDEPRGSADLSTSPPAPTMESWQSQTAIRELEPNLERPSYLASVAATMHADSAVSLPRWIVYFQAGMLGIVATTFFLLGLMISSKSGGPEGRATKLYDCQLTGQVYVMSEGRKIPDEGAVVIVAPVDSRMMDRPDPATLRPDEFEAGENPSIAQIEAAGGRVVRINREGEFDLTLRGPREYFVLVISRSGERLESERIPKSTAADIGGYFFPVEDLLGDKKYQLSRLILNRRSQNLPTIVF